MLIVSLCFGGKCGLILDIASKTDNFTLLGTGHYLCGRGGGVRAKSWGGPGLSFFREKEWAKREFHNGRGWVIVCFVKNHAHYNSCGRSK